MEIKLTKSKDECGHERIFEGWLCMDCGTHLYPDKQEGLAPQPLPTFPLPTYLRWSVDPADGEPVLLDDRVPQTDKQTGGNMAVAYSWVDQEWNVFLPRVSEGRLVRYSTRPIRRFATPEDAAAGLLFLLVMCDIAEETGVHRGGGRG